MWTATIKSKVKDAQNRLTVTVEFTDGTTTFSEEVKPQDKAGFLYFVRQRVDSLNGMTELETEDNVGTEVDLGEPVDTRTQAEKDRDAWFKLYYRWVNVKNNLIDTGVVPATHPKAQALLNEVKAGLQADYIDYI